MLTSSFKRLCSYCFYPNNRYAFGVLIFKKRYKQMHSKAAYSVSHLHLKLLITPKSFLHIYFYLLL